MSKLTAQANVERYLSQLKKAGDTVVMPVGANSKQNHVRHWCEVRHLTVSMTTRRQPVGMMLVTCVRHVAHENEQRVIAKRALDAFEASVARQPCAV